MSPVPPLSAADAERLELALSRLHDAGLHDLAVTGGIAIAFHLARAGGLAARRPLNDVDLVIAGRDQLQPALVRGFLINHAHLDARPGRMLLQLIDPETALRIDIFGAFGGQLARSRAARLGKSAIRLVGAEDLVARLTALLLDLAEGEPLPAKHARDLLALLARVDTAQAEVAWPDHRRPRHPTMFAEATREAHRLVREHENLLVTPRYSISRKPCPSCGATEGFPLAEASAVVAILGYA